MIWLRALTLVTIPIALSIAACTDTADPPTVTRTIIAAPSPSSTTVQAASATPSVALPASRATGQPSKPSRDDANVDARDFEKAPGEYYFISPSRNVWCAIRTETRYPELAFGCQARRSVPGSTGVTCRNADNHAYAVRIEGARVIQFCTSQGIFSAENPRTLNYGETLMVRGSSCTSSTAGITCYQRGGFMISRDVNRVLP